MRREKPEVRSQKTSGFPLPAPCMEIDRAGLLNDVLVLDLADEPGSFCSKLLADLGATVFKVESSGGNLSSTSHAFFYNNTNKLGIVLDPDAREDKQTFGRLLQRADVLVETSPSGCFKSLA